MTRLLVRTETKQNTTREQRAPRILVIGIIGLVGVVGLGLLAVPILVGTNAFFAASAGCSGQQTGTAGQPPVGAKAKSIPSNYLSWYKRSGSSTACRGRSWPASARWRATTARPPCPACTVARTASARPGRCRSASKARPATAGVAHRSIRPARWSAASPPTRTATGSRASTTRPTRSRARPSTCSSSVSRTARRRRSSPTTTCSHTCRAC